MKQVQNNSFISYVLPDQVWWCNINRFLSCSKNYICQFMQVNLWRHKLFQYHLPFWIWKVWKGRGKSTKIWISWDKKSLLDKMKNIFHSFWRPIIWLENKTLTKNSGHKLSTLCQFSNHQIKLLCYFSFPSFICLYCMGSESGL